MKASLILVCASAIAFSCKTETCNAPESDPVAYSRLVFDAESKTPIPNCLVKYEANYANMECGGWEVEDEGTTDDLGKFTLENTFLNESNGEATHILKVVRDSYVTFSEVQYRFFEGDTIWLERN